MAIPEPQEDPAPGKLFEWNGTGRSISHVVIDTNEQRARFYEGQEQVGWTTIASGVSKHPTPRGEFEVIEKVAKKRSNLYGRIYDSNGKLHKRGAHSGKDKVPAGGKFVGASMPHFMRMTYDGIGMHAGPIPRPGQPASHGCIRLPKEVASNLFAHVDLGTRVTVLGNGPDYGNYAQRVREQREQERISRLAAEEAERGATATLASSPDGYRPRPVARSSAPAAAYSAPRATRPQTNASPAVTATDASRPVAQPATQAPATQAPATSASASAGSSPSGTSSSQGRVAAPAAGSGTDRRGPTQITERSIPVPVAPQYQVPAAPRYPMPVPPQYRAPAVAGPAPGVAPMPVYPPANARPYPANQGVSRAGSTSTPVPTSASEATQAPAPAPDADAARSSNEGSTSAAEQDSTTSAQPGDGQGQAAGAQQTRSDDREQEQAAKSG